MVAGSQRAAERSADYCCSTCWSVWRCREGHALFTDGVFSFVSFVSVSAIAEFQPPVTALPETTPSSSSSGPDLDGECPDVQTRPHSVILRMQMVILTPYQQPRVVTKSPQQARICCAGALFPCLFALLSSGGLDLFVQTVLRLETPSLCF